MTLVAEPVPIVIFWAIVGGLGASLLLPSMQSLIHGNFEGAMQRRAYALVGAAAAIAAAVGPLARRLHHDVPLLAGRVRRRGRDHRDRARRQQARPRRPVHGRRGVDVVGAILSAVGMGGVVLGILVWEEGGEAVGALIAVGVVAPRLARVVAPSSASARASRRCSTPDLFESKYFRLGISSQTLQQIALGGLMIALPIYLQMVLEYNALEAGLSIAPLSLSMFARRAARRRREPAAAARARSSGPGSCCSSSASPC